LVLEIAGGRRPEHWRTESAAVTPAGRSAASTLTCGMRAAADRVSSAPTRQDTRAAGDALAAGAALVSTAEQITGDPFAAIRSSRPDRTDAPKDRATPI
jgi:hypothetical protein